jgi:hypothetical protein
MWEPRPLTPLWAFTACYRDSFTLLLLSYHLYIVTYFGVWICWSNSLDLYTTCYNIWEITIFDWTLSTSDHTTLIHYSLSLSLSLSHYPSQSQSYIKTDDQPASLSWNKAPIWGLRPDFYYARQLRVCWCGALSLTRGRVCRLQLLLALASTVILGSGFREIRDHILLSQIRDSPFRRLLRLAGLRWRYSSRLHAGF